MKENPLAPKKEYERSAKPCRILIADDDPEIRSLLKEELTDEGYVIVEARDGITALCEVPFHDFDLIITDWKMPVRNGIEILPSLRESLPGVPVIFMTAFGSEELRTFLESEGIYFYLSKPFDIEILKSMIREALSKSPVRPFVPRGK